jgi:hypothetical protein
LKFGVSVEGLARAWQSIVLNVFVYTQYLVCLPWVTELMITLNFNIIFLEVRDSAGNKPNYSGDAQSIKSYRVL